MYYLFASLRSYTREQMQVEAREYKSRILKQIDNDFQLLHSLSTFLSFSDSLSRQDLVEGLYQTNATNNFVSMALFFPRWQRHDRDPGVRHIARLSARFQPSYMCRRR